MRIRRCRPFLLRALRLAMVDHATSERRSGIMRSVGQKDAGAELTVRRAPLGCRYRPHRRGLQGNPGSAFLSRRKTVFGHGRFRRGHDRRLGRLSKSDYWATRSAAARERYPRNPAASKERAAIVVRQYDLGESMRRLVDLLETADHAG